MLTKKIKCLDIRGKKHEFFENEFIDRHSVYGIHIKNNSLLLTLCTFNNLWSLPGGGKEKNESDLEGLKREFFEETGLNIRDDIKFLKTDVGKIIMSKRPYNNICSYFYVNIDGGNLVINGNGDDVLETEYILFSELKNLDIAPYQKEIILSFSDKKKL